MILDNEDNKILWDIISNFNDSVDLGKKITLDVYINRIEFVEDNAMIYGIGMSPLIPNGCTLNNVSTLIKVGDNFEMSVDRAGEEIKNILKSFIRELKLKNVLN